jgi:membrane protease YdiL (CAAX protease family)
MLTALPVERARGEAMRVIASPATLIIGSYLAALLAAEVMLLTSGLVAGALAHGVLLAALVAHYVAAPRVGYRRLLLVLGLPILMRLIGLAVPLSATPPLVWIVASGTPVLLGAVLVSRAIGATPWTLLRMRARDLAPQLAVAGGGTVHGLLAFQALRPAPIVANLDVLSIASSLVVLAIFAGFTEELIFRGILQPVATETFSSPGAGLVLSTSVFALMYVASLSPAMVAVMLAIGLFFGWIVQESGSLWGVVGAHTLMSLGLLVVWPNVLR